MRRMEGELSEAMTRLSAMQQQGAARVNPGMRLSVFEAPAHLASRHRLEGSTPGTCSSGASSRRGTATICGSTRSG